MNRDLRNMDRTIKTLIGASERAVDGRVTAVLEDAAYRIGNVRNIVETDLDMLAYNA